MSLFLLQINPIILSSINGLSGIRLSTLCSSNSAIIILKIYNPQYKAIFTFQNMIKFALSEQNIKSN